MDSAHLHLLLNHLPVVGTVIGLAALGIGMWRGNEELKKVSLAVFVASAVLALPTYFTGESAEELVEDLAGVSESIIKRHEDAALVALIAVELLGLAALGALVLFQRGSHAAKLLVTTSLVLAVATVGLMARAANLGGQIRHTEIRAQVSTGAPHTAKSRLSDDD